MAHVSDSTATNGRPRSLWILAVGIALALLALALFGLSDAPAKAAETGTTSHEKMPVSFAPNVGQTDERVRYLAQGAGYSFFFTDAKAVLSFVKPAGDGVALDLNFVGANPDAKLEASHRAAGTVNQLSGPRNAWESGVPTYDELTYKELWPGIDMVFRGNGGELKYEFHLRPGADPRDIQLGYAGANGLSLRWEGSLAIHTVLGELDDARPVSYQHVAGKPVPVESRYALHGESGYGFELGSDYDRGQPLVIDPGLAYSTFVGGTGNDSGRGVAVDDEGNAYITGQTAGADYPTTPGAYDPTYNNNVDAFVTKFNRSGSAIVYSTFIGGTAFDSGNSIAVDDQGSAYIAGFTGSPNYPTTPGSYDPSHNGGSDAFVTKLNESGSALDYSTFLGGAGFSFEGANGLAIDAAGSAYVTGFTGSSAFPTTLGAFDSTHNGRNDVFVTKFNPSGSALDYSTFLGGTTSDTGNAIAVDRERNAYVTGFTASTDYPTSAGAPDTTHNGGNDAFVTKLNAPGSALDYSTLLGGTGNDSGAGIAVDEKGKAAHVTGSTASADYPTTPGAHDPSYNGNGDAFVTRFNRSGTALGYSTFLGGTSSDSGNGIAVDEKGKTAYVTGSTGSADYPTTRGAHDPSHNGGNDAFVTGINWAGSRLAYSTFIGGAGNDLGNAIAVDEHRKSAYVTGSSDSADYPTTQGSHEPSYNGGGDAFLARLGIDDDD